MHSAANGAGARNRCSTRPSLCLCTPEATPFAQHSGNTPWPMQNGGRAGSSMPSSGRSVKAISASGSPFLQSWQPGQVPSLQWTGDNLAGERADHRLPALRWHRAAQDFRCMARRRSQPHRGRLPPMGKWGYRKSIVYGLIFSAVGAVVMIIAVNGNAFLGMLAGLFIVALGFSLQQTAAQPLAIILGDP